MSELKFKIIGNCYQDASKHNDLDVDFYLEEDNWNDYSYYTSYEIHASKKITGSANKFLGYIRIMKIGQQKSSDMYLLRSLFKGSKLVFSELPKDFVSLSFSLELFEDLNRLLDIDKRKEFIDSMHLILSEESKWFDATLFDDDCFNSSLLRDSTLDDYSLQRGRSLLEGAVTLYDLRKENIKVQFSHIQEEVALDFSCVDDLSHDLLPNGISVFIGKNGSGKSTAIYKLAKLLYADPTERYRIEGSVGKLMHPNNVGLNKLFLISYSPFDNFSLPAITQRDYKLMFSKDNVEEQRFVYCGIRDLKEEYDCQQQKNGKVDGQDIFIQPDRIDNTSLKSIEQLTEEFLDAMNVIMSLNRNRYDVWTLFCENCVEQQPTLFNDIKEIRSRKLWDREIAADIFKRLSTGHKFLLHSISHLIAYVDDNSLVLFDEPENHLHPPILSFLMIQMRLILAKYKSVVLIATHSPVVVQEVFAKNVYIVNRDGESTTIRKPRIETYGENIGAITTEVFSLTTDITKFYDAFDYLYDKWSMRSEDSAESMLKAFKSKIGHELSSQMESYLINLHSQNSEHVEIE